MRKSYSILSWMLLLLLSLSARAQHSFVISDQDLKEITAAVVHHIQPSNTERNRDRVTITLRIAGKDSDELIRYVISTYPISQRFISNKERIERKHCMFDRHSKLPSLGIDIGNMKLNDDGKAEVVAGFSVCLMGAEQSTYILQKINGQWKVIDEHLEMVI